MKLFSKKNNVPQNEADLLSTAKRVEGNFKKSNYYSSSFPMANFSDTINEFSALLDQMYDTKADKNPALLKIQQAKDEHNDALSFVKGYIREKYGKEAAPRIYPEFGIEKNSIGFTLPASHDAHRDSIFKMITGISKHGFTDSTYGTSFWQPKAEAFKGLLELNNSATGNFADNSAKKANLKIALNNHLTAIRFLARAHNQADYKAEWRILGFLKEQN